MLFDEPSDAGNRRFECTFCRSGDCPCFCRPHELLDMRGTVHVQRLFLRGHVDGTVGPGLADPALILEHTFRGPALECASAADISDDGRLSLADPGVLTLAICAVGPLPAPPRGLPGPDRTAR